MSRLESNLAQKFYNIINEIPSKCWWKFIRRLGLPESDIDEISYENEDLTEQKYQMLSRWKSYFGYGRDEYSIMEFVNAAKLEVMNNSLPNYLNANLQGGLLENRKIATAFYSAMVAISRERRKMFAMTKLQVREEDISSIQADYPKDVDEQCYQMFLTWKRCSNLHRFEDIIEPLMKFVEEFLPPGRQQTTMHGSSSQGRQHNQATGDQSPGEIFIQNVIDRI